MRYSDIFIEDLKSRLRLSDVIGKTVKLKRAGREYVGLSPFNKEKSPSFYVNDEKGFFHDFSSGKHGDLIAFYQETERLSFIEAIERMASEAGVALPAPDPQAARQEEKRQGLQDWLGLAAKWFEGELRRPGGRPAADYLERRGLPADQWARFGVGFAPAARTGLKDYLIAKGAKPAELVEAGLLIAPEDGGAPYDRFRDRIIFPITDTRGRVVSFGGRAMDPNARAKYLNGPDSPLFDKGRTLYGLFEARKLLHAAQSSSGSAGAALVVVEGYMDVIACHRAGVAAVAPMGTALTEGQMELLWRLHGEPTLCFDGDNAGRRAAGRAIDRALPLLRPGRSFRFALVSGGKDPDDVLREQGPAALKAQLSQTTPFVEQLWVRERDAEPLDTPERRTGLKIRLRKLAAGIGDGDLAQAYRDDLLQRFDREVSPAPVSRAGATLANARWDRQRTGGGVWKRGKEPPGRASEEGKASARALSASPRPLSAALALAALADPGVLDDKIERLAARGFHDSQLDAIANELVALRFEADHLEADLVRRRLLARGFDDAAMGRLSRAARKAGVAAPFLDPQTPRDLARSLWSQAFDLLMDLEALERAVSGAKEDMARGDDSAAFMRLKSERDLLKRLIDSGDWQGEATTQALH